MSSGDMAPSLSSSSDRFRAALASSSAFSCTTRKSRAWTRSQYAFSALLITNAENAYWDLVQARDFLVVQEKALELANAALKRSELELKLGAMSPLDIFNPEQNYATAEIGVVQARFQLQ